ncbi:MAG: lysophospholipid acyltransferase family protein [Longimicrobiales bacterium]
MSELKYVAAARIGGLALDGLFRTLHYQVEGASHHQTYVSQGKPVIFALWHGRLLPLGFLHRDQRIASLISASADGEYLARLFDHWGYQNVRGSSSRGGSEALRALVRHVRKGDSLAITPDGPRGPMQKMKSGVLLAAQLTGAPIIPITASATSGWWPGNWDRLLIPKPFSTVHVRYGEPFLVARSADEAGIAQRNRELELVLNRMTDEVDRAARR